MTEFRGPTGVRHAVAEHFRLWLPRHVATCRRLWQLRPEELPLPESVPDDPRRDAYFARPAEALDRWPLLSVWSGRRSQRSIDFSDDGEPIARAVYPIRVFTWVRAEGYDDTQDARDNLAAAVHVTAQAHTNLTGADGFLDHSTLVMDFSDVEKVKGDRYVAGSYVGFNLQVDETLTDRLAMPDLPPGDTVSRVDVTGSVLPHVSVVVEDGQS